MTPDELLKKAVDNIHTVRAALLERRRLELVGKFINSKMPGLAAGGGGGGSAAGPFIAGAGGLGGATVFTSGGSGVGWEFLSAGECPACGSPPGVRCRALNGYVPTPGSVWMHQARREAKK